MNRRLFLLGGLVAAVIAILETVEPRGRSGGRRETGGGSGRGGGSSGCGSRGGPGYRKPNGKCAGWNDR